MLQSGAWPKDMEYLNCDDFQGGNTPERNIDLRQYFTQVCSALSPSQNSLPLLWHFPFHFPSISNLLCPIIVYKPRS